MNPTVNIEMVKMSELPQFMQDSLNRATDQLKIRYENSDFQSLSVKENGDWIDLRAAREYHLEAGKSYMINLGVAMRLPDGYEAHLAPRSSSFKNWGIIQTNSVGVIDNRDGGVRLGQRGNVECTFNISKNEIIGEPVEPWVGFVCVQPSNMLTESFAKCTINMNGNKYGADRMIYGYSGSKDTMLDETNAPKVFIDGVETVLEIMH